MKDKRRVKFFERDTFHPATDQQTISSPSTDGRHASSRRLPPFLSNFNSFICPKWDLEVCTQVLLRKLLSTNILWDYWMKLEMGLILVIWSDEAIGFQAASRKVSLFAGSWPSISFSVVEEWEMVEFSSPVWLNYFQKRETYTFTKMRRMCKSYRLRNLPMKRCLFCQLAVCLRKVTITLCISTCFTHSFSFINLCWWHLLRFLILCLIICCSFLCGDNY